MYFYKKNGKQYLDMRGDLVLSHNNALIKKRTPSAGPYKAVNGRSALNIKRLSFVQKIKLSLIVIGFIWGRDQELKNPKVEE